MILDQIKARILADTTVAGLIGTAMYEGALVRGFSLPAIAYHTVIAPAGYTFQGSANPDEIQIQLDFYGDTAAQVHAVRKAVKDAIRDFRGQLSSYNVLAVFWNFDQDMEYETLINKVTIGFRSMSHVTIWYIAG